jgi:SAM-dependent methyltransferase
MNNEPQTWHYGLVARWWAEFNAPDPDELAFYQSVVERNGPPALDLACGTGRLLLPLLSAGLDVDGCDISPDMLEQCRRAAEAAGVRPALSTQPMDAFRLDRRYRTIYLCDSFGLAGSRERDLETLRRCQEHLEEGGALILTIDAEYMDAEAWNHWLPSGRAAMPEAWPDDVRRRVAADGSEHSARFRFIDVDPLEQTYTREVQLSKWRDGKEVETETYSLRGNMYLKPEVLLMLRVAGFTSITVLGDYTDEPATADTEKLIFRAIR